MPNNPIRRLYVTHLDGEGYQATFRHADNKFVLFQHPTQSSLARLSRLVLNVGLGFKKEFHLTAHLDPNGPWVGIRRKEVNDVET